MKTCTKCKKKKSLIKFSKRYSTKNVYNSWCKTCHKLYTTAYYKKHKYKWKNRKSVYRATIYAEFKKMKESAPCKDCGLFYQACVMDFDHRDPNKKLFNIGSAMYDNSFGWRKIQDEIEKCDLVCSNCHRIRTYLSKHPLK